jgi:hypothetical protein
MALAVMATVAYRNITRQARLASVNTDAKSLVTTLNNVNLLAHSSRRLADVNRTTGIPVGVSTTATDDFTYIGGVFTFSLQANRTTVPANQDVITETITHTIASDRLIYLMNLISTNPNSPGSLITWNGTSGIYRVNEARLEDV